MWYIFPQIEGLGSSAMSQQYAIKSLAEARGYLDHALLGPRLIACVEALLGLEDRSGWEPLQRHLRMKELLGGRIACTRATLLYGSGRLQHRCVFFGLFFLCKYALQVFSVVFLQVSN
jgi:hypothetical protein